MTTATINHMPSKFEYVIGSVPQPPRTVTTVGKYEIESLGSRSVKERSYLPSNALRLRKSEKCGIEVTDGIVWQGWEPGREYTKNIVLKNINVKTQKIKYEAPSCRFFSTLYPKPVVLSAGTSFSLPVTFRPLEKIVYEDNLKFSTKDGNFEVPIKALLPQVNISVPDMLQFDMCAAQDSITSKFEARNTGDLETTVMWDIEGPFFIEPTEVTLKSKESYVFTVTFKPTMATVYETKAVCKYGPEFSHSEVTFLLGIGKLPHILVSLPGKPASSLNEDNLEAVVHFGNVAVDSVSHKYVELHNLSPVNAPFKVEHPTSGNRIDTVFDCPQKHGVVPPLSSIKLPLSYSPNAVDIRSIDYFYISAIGNISKSTVKCMGSSKGPYVQLSAKVINFMQTDVGDTATRSVDIFNKSDVDAVFQFMIDCEESVFKFETVSGTLKGNSKQTLILKFIGQHPINYHRRITCLIHNQGPLFLDLLGTCHSETVKPAMLLPKHLDRYKTHVDRGLSMISPEVLNELLNEGKLDKDEAGCLVQPKVDSNETKTTPDQEVPAIVEYFNDGFHSDIVHSVPHVSMDLNVADFGNCTNMRVIEEKTVNITNHTKGKITVQWMGESARKFSILPLSMDIPPLKSCSFRVSFKPNVPNQFYGAELECYCYYKSLRDYRLVEDTTHCPPWCLTLTCTGHTFMPNNETFLPRYKLDTPKIIFPAVNAQESTYRTLLLTNTGTTPIQYDIQKDPNSIFSLKPMKALLTGEHQIYVVKCTPPVVKTYRQYTTFRLNDNEKYNQDIGMIASAESPAVLLDTDGVLYFKPTCVGTASTRTYSFKNVSRIPLRFEWKMKHPDSKFISVKPDYGIIHPNESLSQTWSFVPQAAEKYVLKPCLITWGLGHSSNSSGGKKKQFVLRVVGEGSVGDIKAESTYLDFGDIVVGSSATKQIVLQNNSVCSLHYKLMIDETIDGPYSDEMNRMDKPALVLEKMEGVLPARSKHIIIATVKPSRRVTYQYAISYQLKTPEGEISHEAALEPQHLCHILTTGVFPTMAVTDARCYGSAVGISKKQLWSLFSLDHLNSSLDSDPSGEELMYNMATRMSHHRRPPVYTRAILDFNFSAAPLGKEACVVNLMLENTGTVPTEWAFMLPCDLQLELEYWAETGEFDEDELHEMKVMENKLFTIEPKKGKLLPGDSQTVTFQYRHTMPGTDRLPVLLKLARGREILLNFIGVTVEPERPYIHFPSSKHMFTPVPVGEKTSPTQVYDLYNGGALPLTYVIDLLPLELVRQENYDHPVFECLNPVGEISPGRSVGIEWRFSPVEAKTYMVDVPIHVDNGETAIMTFTGVGYDKRLMGETMPLSDQRDLTGVPSIQTVAVPGQMAFLSQERISFGNIPLFCHARRIVFVRNKSLERQLSFEWHVTTQLDSRYLNISPIRGSLDPGEGQMCRVTFISSSIPSFYDLDLVCEITDETEMYNYSQKLREWEDEKQRQKFEFTITEKDLNADKRLPSTPEFEERPSSAKLEALDVNTKKSMEGELTRYKTLPPIKQLSPDEEQEERRRRRRKDTEVWQKPEPPIPFLLHLGITARSHDIREFQNNFSDDYKKFHIDRTMSEKSAGKKEKKPLQEEEIPESISCSQSESNVLSGVLSNVLRGLLDDPAFIDAVKKVNTEPVPVFRQFGVPTLEAESPDEKPTEITEKPNSEKSFPQPEKKSTTVVTVTDATADDSSIQEEVETPSAETPRYTKEELNQQDEEGKLITQKQSLKKINMRIMRLPEFGNDAELVIENALLNIMSEALSGDFSITARPRFIALPNRPTSGKRKSFNH